MKIKAKIRAVDKRIADSRTRPATPTPQMPPFRPMTGRPGTVVLPPIPVLKQKRRHRRQHRHIEDHLSVQCSFATREWDYIRAIATRLGLTPQTIIRVSVRRFLAMPDLQVPVSGYIPEWMLGVQRHHRSVPRGTPRVPLVPKFHKPNRVDLRELDDQLLELWADFPPGRRRRKSLEDIKSPAPHVVQRQIQEEIADDALESHTHTVVDPNRVGGIGMDPNPTTPSRPGTRPPRSPAPVDAAGRRLIVRKPTP